MWLVEVAPSAVRALRTAQAADRRRPEAALTGMQVDPFAGDIRRLLGPRRRWRRRVGDWCIIFTVNPPEGIVSIESVVRRSSTTY
jgi:mRNA-degrading endonuclease RelE of RelBE toxin-antitoxin system